MTRNKPTATVIEMQPEDYAKARLSLITMFGSMAVEKGTQDGWSEKLIEEFVFASLSSFELGCHMGMHNPEIAEVWANILGGPDRSERWQQTHEYSHMITNMLTGDVVAEHVDVSAAVDLINKLNKQDRNSDDKEGEGNERPN